jgi:hypothetical protein
LALSLQRRPGELGLRCSSPTHAATVQPPLLLPEPRRHLAEIAAPSPTHAPISPQSLHLRCSLPNRCIARAVRRSTELARRRWPWGATSPSGAKMPALAMDLEAGAPRHPTKAMLNSGAAGRPVRFSAQLPPLAELQAVILFFCFGFWVAVSGQVVSLSPLP